jgi:hypothetical protein
MRIETPEPAVPGENDIKRSAAVVGMPSRQAGNRLAAVPAVPAVDHDGVTPWGNAPRVQVPARLSDVAPQALEPTPVRIAIPLSLMASAQRGSAAAMLPQRAIRVDLPAPFLIEAESAELVVPEAAPDGGPAPAPAPVQAQPPQPAHASVVMLASASSQATAPTEAAAPMLASAATQASAPSQDSAPTQASATGQASAGAHASVPARAPDPSPAPAAVRRARPGLADRLHTAWFELHRAVGWTGAAGIGLLLLGTALVVGLAPALQDSAEQLASDAVANREQRAQHRVEQLSAPSGAEVVQRFLEGFPPATQQVDDLAFLVQEAKAAGVQLARADYNLRAEPTLGLTYYQVNLPVQARYATLRRFTAGVLNARQNAALDELSLERKEGDEIQARVRFTFVYRSGDGQ